MSLRVQLTNFLARWSTNGQYMALPAGGKDQRTTFRSRRTAVVIVLVATCLLSLTWLSSGGSSVEADSISPPVVNHTLADDTGKQWGPLSVLEGPPTIKFRGMRSLCVVRSASLLRLPDNLRDDKKYITAWIGSGWSELQLSILVLIVPERPRSANDVMSYVSASFASGLTHSLDQIFI